MRSASRPLRHTRAPHPVIFETFPCSYTTANDRMTKAEHLSLVSSTNLGVKYSPRAEIQSRQRVNLIVFVELAIGRSGVGSFLVENPTCRDFMTAQLNEINHLHPRYEPQTAYNLSDVRITTTDTFGILFSFSLEKHSHPNSSRGPLHNYLTTYQSNAIPPKVKLPTKKQEDVCWKFRLYVSEVSHDWNNQDSHT